MSVLAVTTFLALLALAAAAGALGLLLWAAASRFAPGAAEALQSARASLGPLVLWLAFAVAIVSTLGSLYLSEALLSRVPIIRKTERWPHHPSWHRPIKVAIVRRRLNLRCSSLVVLVSRSVHTR